MINIKPKIVKALDENQALISLLGGPRIYQIAVPIKEADRYPRITYFEINNVDDDYGDDDPLTSRISVQISIWTKDTIDTSGATQLMPIAQEVDKAMKGLGFVRTIAFDLYEDDTKVFHKAMRYTGKFLRNEE